MMLEIKNLNVFYGKVQALKDISLSVAAGQVVSIIGANGAGKSTLLKAVSGLISERRGTISFEGVDIATHSANRIVGLGLSQVAEGRQIFAHMTVEDNIRLSIALRGGCDNAQPRIADVAARFGILDRLNHRPRQLSVGDRQRVQ